MENVQKFAAQLAKLCIKDDWVSIKAELSKKEKDLQKKVLNTRIDGYTGAGTAVIHVACRHSSKDLVKILLEAGADVNLKDNYGRLSIHHAAEKAKLKTIKYLVEKKGVDICARDKKGEEPIHIASRNGYTDIVQYILQSKGSTVISHEDNTGLSPFICAAFNNCVEVLEVLGSMFAYKDDNKTVWKKAVLGAVERGHVETVEYLLTNGLTSNDTFPEGLGPLHSCAHIKCKDKIDAMLGCLKKIFYQNVSDDLYSACAAVKCISGRTVVEYAVCIGNIVAVEALLKIPTLKVNALGKDNWQLIHHASSKGHVDMMKYLLKNGAVKDRTTSGGRLPIHLTCMGGFLDATNLLLELYDTDAFLALDCYEHDVYHYVRQSNNLAIYDSLNSKLDKVQVRPLREEPSAPPLDGDYEKLPPESTGPPGRNPPVNPEAPLPQEKPQNKGDRVDNEPGPSGDGGIGTPVKFSQQPEDSEPSPDRDAPYPIQREDSEHFLGSATDVNQGNAGPTSIGEQKGFLRVTEESDMISMSLDDELVRMLITLRKKFDSASCREDEEKYMNWIFDLHCKRQSQQKLENERRALENRHLELKNEQLKLKQNLVQAACATAGTPYDAEIRQITEFLSFLKERNFISSFEINREGGGYVNIRKSRYEKAQDC